MAFTITLLPTTEEKLRALAAASGEDPNHYAAVALTELVDERYAADADYPIPEGSQDSVAGIQEGLDDFAAGRFHSFAESAAEARRKHNLPTHLTDDELTAP